MKRKIFIILFCLLCFTGCGKKEETKQFVGEIKSIYSNNIIVEPFKEFDEGKNYDKISFEKIDDTEYRIGEILKITYDGGVKESYPAQIVAKKIFSMDLGDLCATKESTKEFMKKNVVMEIKEDTLSASGATIILKNNSKKNYRYGETYSIDVKKDDKWYTIDVFANFELPAYNLDKQSEKEIEIKWENGYGKLPKGYYRVVKDIMYEKKGKFNTYYVASEFEIK